MTATLFRPDLVASDLDGTLLPPDLEFTPQTIAGIAALRAAGVVFAICTGRMFQSARDMAARLDLHEGLIVCYQGALVADLGTGEWLLHLPMSGDKAAEVVRKLRALRRHVNVFIDDEYYVEELDEWARRYAEYSKVECHAVGDLAALVKRRPPTKIVVSAEPDDAADLLPQLQDLWAGQLYVTRSLPHLIEINDEQATKSNALEFVCRRLGLRRERTVTCGDGLNDVDMLRWAGLGVAMAQAVDEVRASADLVVTQDDLGGLFEGLATAPR
jgi:Cof subfamily protein (haloacid dehalogenase superfamily)